MGIFFRKRISMGPLRFNLSGSGIGVSTGIKGLRVGVSGKGKTYVAGGRGGIYFRQNLSPSRSGHQAVAAPSAAPVATPAKPLNIIVVLIILLALLICFGLERNELFIAAGALGIIIIIVAIVQFRSARKLKEWRNVMTEAIKSADREKIKRITAEIIKLKNLKKRHALLAQFYPDLALSFLHDNALDREEEEILTLYNSQLPGDVVKTINLHLVNELLHAVAADRRINTEEEALVRRCAAIFKLPEMNDEINQVIADYRELEKIETGGLTPISPKLNINDPAECYYEKECVMMKRKTTRGVTELLPDASGTLLITRDNLHFVSDGHTAIKTKNIIKIEKHEDEDILEMVLNNRKTPVYVKVKDPMAVMGIVRGIIHR